MRKLYALSLLTLMLAMVSGGFNARAALADQTVIATGSGDEILDHIYPTAGKNAVFRIAVNTDADAMISSLTFDIRDAAGKLVTSTKITPAELVGDGKAIIPGKTEQVVGTLPPVTLSSSNFDLKNGGKVVLHYINVSVGLTFGGVRAHVNRLQFEMNLDRTAGGAWTFASPSDGNQIFNHLELEPKHGFGHLLGVSKIKTSELR